MNRRSLNRGSPSLVSRNQGVGFRLAKRGVTSSAASELEGYAT